jgi:hypothetical protein
MNRALDIAQKTLRYPISLLLGQLPVTIGKAVLTVRRGDEWHPKNINATDPIVNTRDYVDDLKWHWNQTDTPADKYFHRGAVITCLALRLAAGIGAGMLWHDAAAPPKNNHSFVQPLDRSKESKATTLFQDASITPLQLQTVAARASIGSAIPSLRASRQSVSRAREGITF